VVEFDPERVQERPPEPVPAASFLVAAAVPVGRIAEDRVADVAEVGADLVRAPGPGPRLDQGEPRALGEHAVVRHGLRIPRAPDEDLGPVPGGELLALQRGVDGPLPRMRHAEHEGEVGLAHLPPAQGLLEPAQARRGEADEDDPRGVPVEAVREGGAEGVAPARREGAEDGVEERRLVPGVPLVDEEPRRLVHGQHVVVAVEDLEGRRRRGARPPGLRGAAQVGEPPSEEQRHLVPLREAVLGPRLLPVHDDLLRAEQLEDEGERRPRQVLAEEPVDALSRVVRPEGEGGPGGGHGAESTLRARW